MPVTVSILHGSKCEWYKRGHCYLLSMFHRFVPLFLNWNAASDDLKDLTTLGEETCLVDERALVERNRLNSHVKDGRLQYEKMPEKFYLDLICVVLQRYTEENDFIMEKKDSTYISRMKSRMKKNLQLLKDKMEFFHYYHGFKLTNEILLKIVLVLHRSLNRMPIVLLGESGSGKTFLLKFLGKCLLQEMGFYYELQLHSGVKIKKFVTFVERAVEKAKVHPRKVVWVFFDELNRSQFQAYVSDMMTNRAINLQGGKGSLAGPKG